MPHMYANTAYLRNEHDEVINHDVPLIIGSCGSYRLVSKPRLNTIWEGRGDYQLLYINNGRGHFYKHGKEHIVSAGEIILYEPYELQQYFYTVQEHIDVCWVHFSGNSVEHLLQPTGILDQPNHTLEVGVEPEYRDLFERMIMELQLQRPQFNHILSLTFQTMLRLFARHQAEHNQHPHNTRHIPPTIRQAVLYFNQHYAEQINVKSYAQQHHVNESYFIAQFRAAMGATPLQYITAIRIRQAQFLPRSTDFPINEISFLVGYDNPLYFSRLFRQKTGLTPSQARTIPTRKS